MDSWEWIWLLHNIGIGTCFTGGTQPYLYQMCHKMKLTDVCFLPTGQVPISKLCANAWHIVSHLKVYYLSLHNIIINVEGLQDLSSNDCGSLDANDGTQFKKSRIHNSVTASAKQTWDLFCKYFNSPAGSVPWQEEATGDMQ